MSKPLKLSLTKVTCQDEQVGEPGKDEMYFILFGITGGGQRLYVPPTGLGSYGKGDVNKSTFPKTLIDVSVGDGESLAAICIWLFERDSGGLAQSGAALESSYNIRLGDFLAFDAPVNLPPAALHLYAFAQSMVGMRFALQVAAHSYINSDELLLPHFHHLVATLPQPGVGNGFEVQIQGGGAKYLLRFDLHFLWEPVVIG
jgi:hypothetical protein